MEDLSWRTEEEAYAPPRNILSGANWFYWVAILSVINTLIIYFFNIPNMPIALGLTQWVDGTTGPMNAEGWYPPLKLSMLVIDLLIAAAFAGFGYLARKGSDPAFVVGIFVYVVDLLLVIGLRDFWAAVFHLVPLFFMFKGLLASRHLRENATSF
jgi:hypothetical protein